MKTIKIELAAIKTSLAQKLEEREITFEEKSERWQESERGELYQSKTEELEEVISNLEMTIDSLDLFLE